MARVTRRQFLRTSGTGLGLLVAGAAGCAAPLTGDFAPKRGRRVVVIGGGWGGATAARYVRLADPSIEVALLINGGSASAAEIVAAALDETDRATLIGEPTFGKNTVQIWDELVNGGGVRITISRWFTPNHHSVAPEGVQPDIVVSVPEGTPPDEDPVLDRALAYLATVDQDAAERPDATGSAQRIRLSVVGWAPETGLWAAWGAC